MADGMNDDSTLNASGRPRVVISTRHGAAAAAAGGGSSSGGSAFASSAAPAASSASSAPRSVSVRTKGRGFARAYGEGAAEEDRYAGKGGEFESIDERGEEAGGALAQKSVEGWIVIARGLHDETNEDDLYELFSDHGDVKQLHLNLDRRTGFVKGYALIEYGAKREAEAAIAALNGHSLHDKQISVDWAFKPPPHAGANRGTQRRSQGGGRGPRDRQ